MKKVREQNLVQKPHELITMPIVGKFIVVHIIAKKEILAPAHAKSYLEFMLNKYGLLEKYSEQAKHLDRIFVRAFCPIHRKLEPCETGSCLKAVLAPLIHVNSVIWHGIFTDESNVVLDSRSTTTMEGRKTVQVFELIPPGAELHAVIEYKTDEAGKQVVELIKNRRRIYIGGKISRGFGEAEITRIEVIDQLRG